MDLGRSSNRRLTTFLQQQVAYDERLKRVMNHIHAAKDVD